MSCHLPSLFSADAATLVLAAFATVLVVLPCLSRAMPPAIYWIWNTLGLVDIIFVVTTATRLALRSPDSMVALLQLPLSLLPTFLVPLIIFTHVVTAIRFFRLQGGLGYLTPSEMRQNLYARALNRKCLPGAKRGLMTYRTSLSHIGRAQS